MNNPMKQQIDRWLKSDEFLRFLESGQLALTFSKQEKMQDDRILQEKLIEMGRFYNHIMIQMTKEFLDQIKQVTDKSKKEVDPESIARALSLYITEFEEEALNRFGAVFQFFAVYRERTKNPLDPTEEIEEDLSLSED